MGPSCDNCPAELHQNGDYTGSALFLTSNMSFSGETFGAHANSLTRNPLPSYRKANHVRHLGHRISMWLFRKPEGVKMVENRPIFLSRALESWSQDCDSPMLQL